MASSFTFRTTTGYKIAAIFFLLMFSAPFYFIILVDTLATKLAIATFTFVIVIITVERIVVPFWSNYLVIDETGMRGVVTFMKVNIRWEDVKTIWQPEASSVHQSITFSTTQGIQEIYIRHFDRKGIWNAVRGYVKPEAFESITYRTLPEYRRVSTNLTNLFSLIEFPLRSNLYPARVIGLFGLVLFTLFFIIGLKYLPCMAPLFGLFVLLSMLAVIGIGTIEIDPTGITHHAWFGKYGMEWDEIQWIEQDPTGGWMVLYGENKRLSIPGPPTWPGKQKEILYLFFQHKIWEHEIKMVESVWANFKIFNKNTKLR